MKNILFAASESLPFLKTGGLADVVGSLPKNLDKRYYDCRVVMPYYSCIPQKWKDQMEFVTSFYMDFNYRSNYVGVLTCQYEGVTFYFIDNQDYFTGDKPYEGIPQDLGRFMFFSKAVLAILPNVDFRPDLIHCHDWQTGLVPVYLNSIFQDNEFYWGIKSVMTIHNLKFQGIWDLKTVQSIAGLPDYYFTPDKLEYKGDGNMLKGGLVYANALTTVSSTYAEEIKTPYYGEGLDGLMRARSNDLRGIVNGIDYDSFNPADDENLSTCFTVDTFRRDKKKVKMALQKELGLPVDSKVMTIGIVSRLTDQKGFDLIAHVMDEMCQDAVQFIVLGTGSQQYEDMFRYFAEKYPDKVSAQLYYNEALSHKIYAACDAFLMPSQFEPCGLSQLISLRYGCVPIVRETGGLKDTVEPYNEYEHTGTGFSFSNYNAHEMMDVVRYAESVFYDKKREWNKIVERGMKADFSWKQSALKYQELYDWLIGF
ncbi:MAG: glycogen synthase GlgA [Lachnospiraceae bacterium]|nr:glycogen synthase GlgA [Candidatus Equihabitans merdae]